jgi:ketosteroid isomerase-like protein
MKTLIGNRLLVLFVAGMATAIGASQADTDVMAAMNAWKQATLAKDRPALEQLLHKDLTFTHSSGETWNRSQLIDHYMSADYVPHSIEFSDVSTRVYGDAALVSCVVDLKSKSDGKETSAHHKVLHVWLKSPQGWQLVARQATKLEH